MISQHNAAWQEWFSSAGIEPFPVLYEEDFLDLELPPGRELAVQHRRLADELSTPVDRSLSGRTTSGIELQNLSPPTVEFRISWSADLMLGIGPEMVSAS